MSGPIKKVGLYLVTTIILAVMIRLINHAWPPLWLLGEVAGMSYFLYRKAQALDKRVRLADEAERRAGRS